MNSASKKGYNYRVKPRNGHTDNWFIVKQRSVSWNNYPSSTAHPNGRNVTINVGHDWPVPQLILRKTIKKTCTFSRTFKALIRAWKTHIWEDLEGVAKKVSGNIFYKICFPNFTFNWLWNWPITSSPMDRELYEIPNYISHCPKLNPEPLTLG